MRLSAKGLAFIAAHEACYLFAYPDPGTGGDPITIGFGHTAAAGGMRPKMGDVITLVRACEILQQDLRKYERGVLRALKGVKVTQEQFDALVSFHFNTGSIKSGTVDDKLIAGDIQGAMNTLKMYVNSDGRRMSGLVRRRQEEARLFMHGQYPNSRVLLRRTPTSKPESVHVRDLPFRGNKQVVIDLPERKPEPEIVEPGPQRETDILSVIINWIRKLFK